MTRLKDTPARASSRNILGQIALYAARLSGFGCLGTLLPLTFIVIRLFVEGPPDRRAAHSPSSVDLTVCVILACLALWIVSGLVGLVTGLLSTQTQSGSRGLWWSALLLCLLPAVYLLIVIMPKS